MWPRPRKPPATRWHFAWSAPRPYARLGGDDAKQKLVALEEGIDKFTPDDQATLWEGLGNAYQRLNTHSGQDDSRTHEDYEAVRRCFQKLVDRHPDDLYPWENMFDLAIMYHESTLPWRPAEADPQSDRRHREPLVQVLRRIADRSSKSSTEEEPNVAELDEARKLVDEALRVRPEWHQLYRLARRN